MWYLIGKTTNTGVGVTEERDVGKVVGQGTVGGALTSQLNIDKCVDRYFYGSTDECNYGPVRMQPMSFQDDLSRIVLDTAGARAGNVKLASVLKEKQLEAHSDKTGFVVFGTKDYK